MDSFLGVKKSDPNSSYTCTSCGKVCVNWRAFVYHQKSRHSETDGKKFSCTLCGRQFYTRHRLKKHALGHQKGKHHCCHVCGKLFESNKKLTVHSLVHKLSGMHDQNLQCGDCGRRYSDWIPFKQHMKTHGAEGVCYPCGLCKESFPTQYELEKHRRVHKQFQCEFCDRYFRSASVLSVHLRVHTGERPYKCGLCNRDFSQSCVLKVHMRTHAKDGRYECNICGLVLHDVMEYYRHHIAHLEEGNLQCEECGRMFDDINSKNRHMASHRERDGRQCHVCGKEFGRVSHLEAHMLSHSESDPTPLTCKVCSKTFSSQELLTTHYSTHMTGDISSSEAAISASTQGDQPLFCGVCGKMFRDKAYLRKHLRKHDKEARKSIKFENILDEDVVKVENGPFACVDCGKAFGKSDHLTVHRREHTGECPHACCMCGQSFMLRSQLLKHIREHRQSGVMMYLDLDEGGVCAQISDIKDVLKFSDTDNWASGAEENNMKGSEQRFRINSDPSHSETQLQQKQSTQSQKEKRPDEFFHNISEADKSDSNRVQYRFIEQSQIPQLERGLNNQDKSHNHHHLPLPSDNKETSSYSVSMSIGNQTSVTGNMIHHQIPIPQKKRDLTSVSETMSSMTHTSAPASHAHQVYSGREGNCLLPRHELSATSLTANNRITLVNQTALPGNNTHSQKQQENQQPIQPYAPVALQLPSNQLISKSNSSHGSAFSLPRTYMPSPALSNAFPHHHYLSAPTNGHGQSNRFNADLHHTLDFQLLPQTAFPENCHQNHM